ncbi:hypothetical protein J5X84_24720 [Streptosporangiaceae bacterium NEAU-GS5]|nr:hypothetical protein [Streptosporangiaceae bacterium NEAU-GS5]
MGGRELVSRPQLETLPEPGVTAAIAPRRGRGRSWRLGPVRRDDHGRVVAGIPERQGRDHGQPGRHRQVPSAHHQRRDRERPENGAGGHDERGIGRLGERRGRPGWNDGLPQRRQILLLNAPRRLMLRLMVGAQEARTASGRTTWSSWISPEGAAQILVQ